MDIMSTFAHHRFLLSTRRVVYNHRGYTRPALILEFGELSYFSRLDQLQSS